jgi:hypothetical protein
VNNLRVFSELRGVTWLRDSHQLFDYESKNVQRIAITVRDVYSHASAGSSPDVGVVVSRDRETMELVVDREGDGYQPLLRVAKDPTSGTYPNNLTYLGHLSVLALKD